MKCPYKTDNRTRCFHSVLHRNRVKQYQQDSCDLDYIRCNLQCYYMKRASWNKVNQTERYLRTKDGHLFRKQTTDIEEYK